MRRELLLLEEMIDALLWNFTVLGEAAAQLPDDLKRNFPAVPWRQPSRLRNRIVHGYWSLDLDILITTAQRQLPEIAGQLRAVYATLDPRSDMHDESEPSPNG